MQSSRFATQGADMETNHEFRMEGLTLTVADVQRSIAFYRDQLGLTLEWDASPQFAMLRLGVGPGATLGLLSRGEAEKEGAKMPNAAQARAVHVELSTDQLDDLCEELRTRGVRIDVLPHDEPWERAMTIFDPDGYSVEFAQGRRGKK
jgi:catechol 2,3-dioxygenase-like lactoylglutathione lyase family enzyme